MNGIRIEEEFKVLIVLTPKCTEMFLILNTLRQKALLFLQMVASDEKHQGEKLHHLVCEQRKSLFRGACQQDAKMTLCKNRISCCYCPIPSPFFICHHSCCCACLVLLLLFLLFLYFVVVVNVCM